jgi:hypothetical protein
MSNQQVNASDIRNFTIFPTNGGKEVDISAQIQELSYYENILSNSLTCYYCRFWWIGIRCRER